MLDDLTLRPHTSTAVRWSGAALLLVAFGVWFVADTAGDPIMWSLLGLMVAVAAFFVLQFVAPGWFEVHLDEDGIRARTLWQRIDVPWDRVRSASIHELAGEAYLEVHVIEELGDGWVVRPAAVLLPLGADIPALRMAIARARARGHVAA